MAIGCGQPLTMPPSGSPAAALVMRPFTLSVWL